MASAEATAARVEGESATARNFFDLRVIIGGLFTVYGVYLTILGILDSQEAVEKAAGVRINLWTGLGMLALSTGFLLWAKLRPLSVERIVEAQAENGGAGREDDAAGSTPQEQRGQEPVAGERTGRVTPREQRGQEPVAGERTAGAGPDDERA
jgi:hypothetical protein